MTDFATPQTSFTSKRLPNVVRDFIIHLDETSETLTSKILRALPVGGSPRRSALVRLPAVGGQQRLTGRTSASGLDLYLFLVLPAGNETYAQCDALIIDGSESVYFCDLRLDELPALFSL